MHESALLMRLGIATQHFHAAVDAPWLALMRPTVTSADYLSVLVRMYGFLGPFEGACRYTPDVERMLELVQHPRAGLVAQDLLALGLSPVQLSRVPQCHAITTFGGVAEALGWMYVVERTTLVHEDIERHLLHHVPGVARALAYLSAYDGQIDAHWARLGRLLDGFAERPDVANEIIVAAHAAFATLQAWFAPDRD